MGKNPHQPNVSADDVSIMNNTCYWTPHCVRLQNIGEIRNMKPILIEKKLKLK